MIILKSFKMGENHGEDLSDLEMQNKTWKKVEKNMKLIGFREGAAKGRDDSLQEGFDVGYAAGFDLGKEIGQIKGVLSCPVELTRVKGFGLLEKNLEIALDKTCVMCLKGKSDAGENKNENYPDMDEIIVQQQKLSSEVINNLKDSNLNVYLDKT